MKKVFLIFLLNIFSFYFFAQSNKQERILTVTSPRMYGEDVKYIQNKLLEMGFSEIGEIDGYYGPKTEAVVKEFQNIVRFNSNGIVSKQEYNFFKNPKSELIIKAVYTWKTLNRKATASFWKNFKMKHSPNGKIYITKENGKTAYCNLLIVGDNFSYQDILFKENDSTWFVIHKETLPKDSNGYPYICYEYAFTESYYLFFYIEDTLYCLYNGELTKTEDEDILEYIKYCKELF